MSCILTCYWKLQSQICTYYATLYFASVTMGCLGLSCLQIFANFAAELCCRPELFWSQLTLTIIYIFLLFQTGVPHYEDFISKAGKLHSHLKWVVQYQPRLLTLTGFCDHLPDQPLMLSTTQCTPSKFMRAFYLKLSIFCSGSLPAIYEPFSLNIRVLEGLGYHIGVAVKCCDYISFSPFFCYMLRHCPNITITIFLNQTHAEGLR